MNVVEHGVVLSRTAMFIGHFALGFAAKRATPRVSLLVLFVAAQLADLLWPVFLLLGAETVRIEPGNTAFTPLDFVSYPYSHSLVALIAWGLLLGFLYSTKTRDRLAFLVISLLVVSHWVLDFITHRPDMPLYPSGPKFGLGLWNSVGATVVVEFLMYTAGLWLYVHATRPRDKIGHWAFVGFAVSLLIAYAANIVGAPPPSVQALAVFAIIGALLLLLWSWWADHHREGLGH
jgi:hypothetical protein